MIETIYHALGLCGDMHHPSLLNVTAIVLIASILSRAIYKRRASEK